MADVALGAVVTLAFTFGGGLERLHEISALWLADGIARGLALIALTALAARLIDLPLDDYRAFVIAARFGFNKMTRGLFFADAAMLYMTYSDMLITAGEISRKMSVGEVQTEGQARDYASERLSLGSNTYSLNADFRTDTVTISTPLVTASLSGWWLQSMIGSTLYATSTTRREPLN